MGTRGPKATPTVLQAVPDKRRRREVRPAPGKVTPPKGLSRGALEVWRRKAPELIEKELLTPWSADAFAEYCQAVDFARVARLELVAEGTVVAGYRGSKVKNPAFQIWRDALATSLQVGARFGMTPADLPGLPSGSRPRGERDRFFTP